MIYGISVNPRMFLPEGLIEALNAPPEEVTYCLNCDGLRTHSTADCPYPDKFREPPRPQDPHYRGEPA